MSYVIVILALVLSGCGLFRSDPPKQQMTPGSTLLYHGGREGIWVTCFRTDKLFLNESGQFYVVAGGCPAGVP